MSWLSRTLCPIAQGVPAVALNLWVTQEEVGLPGQPVLRNLWLPCNPVRSQVET